MSWTAATCFTYTSEWSIPTLIEMSSPQPAGMFGRLTRQRLCAALVLAWLGTSGLVGARSSPLPAAAGIRPAQDTNTAAGADGLSLSVEVLEARLAEARASLAATVG